MEDVASGRILRFETKNLCKKTFYRAFCGSYGVFIGNVYEIFVGVLSAQPTSTIRPCLFFDGLKKCQKHSNLGFKKSVRLASYMAVSACHGCLLKNVRISSTEIVIEEKAIITDFKSSVFKACYLFFFSVVTVGVP